MITAVVETRVPAFRIYQNTLFSAVGADDGIRSGLIRQLYGNYPWVWALTGSNDYELWRVWPAK